MGRNDVNNGMYAVTFQNASDSHYGRVMEKTLAVEGLPGDGAGHS